MTTNVPFWVPWETRFITHFNLFLMVMLSTGTSLNIPGATQEPFFFKVFILFVCFVCFPLCICLKKRKTDKKRKGNSHLTPQLVRISTFGPKQLYSQFYSYHRWLSPWSRKLKHGWYLASPWEPSWSHITAAGHSGHEAAMRKTTGGRGRYFRRSSKSALLTLHTYCEGSCIRLLVLQTSLNKDIGCMV